jgi:phage/plasmid-associated DNA primase
MNNKRLEAKLIEKKQFVWISILEQAEKLNIVSITIDKKPNTLFTGSVVLDAMVIKHLKQMGINLTYATENTEKENIIVTDNKNHEKVFVNCDGNVHALKAIKKLEDRKKAAEESKMSIFILNDILYATCSKCHNFEKL